MTEVKVVIGANFGDEGKGLMTDYFCNQSKIHKKSSIVVLSNGGSQRGHTVDTADGRTHVFHHFGSGAYSGSPTYCPSEYIINPMTYVQEWEDLIKDGANTKLFYNKYCKWTTPYDIIINQILEESRGDKRHGSCGVGIWETEYRYSNTKLHYTLSEFNLMPTDSKVTYLKELRDGYCINRLRGQGVDIIPEEWKDIYYSESLIMHYLKDINFFCSTATQTENLNILNDYDTVIFENGQGLLLDQSLESMYGDNLTPSNTGSANSIKLINNVNRKVDVELCYVSRTYMTRHGAGRFETECNKSNINPIINDLHNITNQFQGSLRYGELIIPNLMSRIDLDSYVGAKKLNAKVSVAFTHTNELDIDVEPFMKKYSTVYTSDNKTNESVKIKCGN